MALDAVSAPLELRLDTVIIFKGPGAWKREARWDEYHVSLGNRGDLPVTVDTAELVDLQGQPRLPGDEPWLLEKQSRSNWQRYGKAGLHVVEGVGATALYAGAVMAVGETAVLSGGAASGGLLVLSVIPVVGLVDVVAVATLNHKNRKKVQAEFARRRLALPAVIPAGAAVSGSLFFPMTPGPQRLLVRGHTTEQPIELVLDLAPLAGLHLEPAK